MKFRYVRALIAVLLLYILLIPSLTGCSDVPSRHAALAEASLAQLNSADYLTAASSENDGVLLRAFLQSLRFVDAAGEIRDARSSGKSGNLVTYDLTLAPIALDRTDCTAFITGHPDIDWSSVTAEGYARSLYSTFISALSDYLKGQNFLTRRSPVTFTFEKQHGQWSVTPDSDAIRSLCRDFLAQVSTCFEEYRAESDYYSVLASERVNKALSAETRYPTVFSNTTVVKMVGHADESYEVTLDTVDYADFLSVVSDAVYKSYKQKNPDGVYAPPDSSILIALMEKEMLDTDYTPVLTQIVLDSESGDPEYICDLISELIQSQLEVEADEMSDRIRDYLIRESVSEPRTQIRKGADNPKTYIPFKIYAPDHYDSHYFKIYDATNGELVMTIYIREGDSITAYLPEGSYTIRYCTGKRWYGYEELFGPDGDYLRFNETFRFKKGNKYSLFLYQTTDVNLTTRLLNNEEF